MRLDEWLVLKTHLSRTKAIRFIQNRGVLIDDKLILKPSYRVKSNDEIEIDHGALHKYNMPLGYHKLEWITNYSDLSFTSSDLCLDVGASAGGFSLYMLEKVRSVLAIEFASKFDPILQKISSKHRNFSYRIRNFFEMELNEFPHLFNVITADLTLDPRFVADHLIKFSQLLQPESTPLYFLLILKIGKIKDKTNVSNYVIAKVEKNFPNFSYRWIKSFPGKREQILLVSKI